MSINQKSSKNGFNFSLKPIPFIVFSIFAQHVYAEALTLAQAEALSNTRKQCEEKANTSRAKAQCKVNEQLQAQFAADDAYDQAVAKKEEAAKQRLALAKIGDVDAVLFGEMPQVANDTIGNARLKVSPEIIRTAEATDAATSNTPNKANQPSKSNDGKNNINSKTMGAKEGKDLPLDIKTQTVNVRAKRFHEIGPLPGLGLTKEEIPGNVQSVTAQQIKDSHSLSIADLMNSQLQSVNVNDYQGNPFQMDVQYRGFTASPQIGTPQGLSVFFDGIRVNEPFGDVVNWDMIPMNALAGLDVFPGSNPIFGLGTLGGALSMKTKDGFTHEGVDGEILTGSFGRKQLQISSGWNNGTIGLFGAGNFFLEDGWRDNSPSKVNQIFGKASYRGDKLDVSLSTLLVTNDLVGNGLIPSQMYAQDRNGVFTSPDTTKNKLAQFQLSGDYFVNDNFTITGQVYRRDSRRKQLGADVYTEYGQQLYRRNLNPGDPANGIPAEEFTCLFNSSNQYRLPDYYIIDVPDPNDFSSSAFLNDFFNTGVPDLSLLAPDAFNRDLPPDFATHAQSQFNFFAVNTLVNLFYSSAVTPPIGPGDTTSYSNGEPSYEYNGANFQAFSVNTTGFAFDPIGGLSGPFFYTPDGVKHYMAMVGATNQTNCQATQASTFGGLNEFLGELDPVTGSPRVVDGAGSNQSGVVEGTPTAVLTNTEIDQITDGASVQLNWNLEHHKFMVGASIDAASAEYGSGQRLGLLDAQRNAYLAPDEIRDQYAAADQEVRNNDFSGISTTKSVYASETWSPVDNWHFTGAMRYNDTKVKNKLAQRTAGDTALNLSYFANVPDGANVCVNGVCPPTGYKLPDLSKLLRPAETEKFSYYSLNPSFGATWQAKENLNIYANWAQGVRTPSVIELGCALDKTPTTLSSGAIVPKSVAERRSCQLPSTLSGDPYLPQIKATTYDIGMRGQWGETMEWNIGAYQTDLKDDIYMITYPGNQNFFDSIGKTRRRGIEAGLSGGFGKAKFKLNYALTDATFQDTFMMASDDNSSAVVTFNGEEFGRSITVKPGNRMPGVPLHNLNASVSYDVTDKWQVGLNAVLHSESYVRGNENNKHKPGVVRVERIDVYTGGVLTGTRDITLQPTTSLGTVPGFAVFNFNTRYKFTPEWTLGLQVNNIFDREYFSAGRLGRNPFSPSINGAIGPDGYNHNSSDWLSANFLAPGAPRAAWISLSYEFVPDKK